MKSISFGHRLNTYYDISFQETDYIRKLADEYFKKEYAEKAKLLTKEDVISRRKKMQKAFRDAIGVLPDRHCPLNVKICNEHILPSGVTIQNITYESLPNVIVTATIYLPKDYKSDEKLPAALNPIGHSPVGRAHPNYTVLAQKLAECGIVVLSVDPPGQHERVQYPNAEGKSTIGGAVAEHFQIGFPCHLSGLTLKAFFVRDLERGIDFLESLPYVDSSRIGITGQSGGGMMTAAMSLLDDRLVAAAPCCFISSRQAILLSGRPQDSEQIVPDVIKNGINHDDFMALLAPKPHLICVADYDGVDIAGGEYTHEICKAVYRIFGCEENARFMSVPATHALSDKHIIGITNFLTEVLDAKVKNVGSALPKPISVDLLKSTKSGCVILDYPDAISLYDYVLDFYSKNKYTPCNRAELKNRVLRIMRTPSDAENRGEILHPRYISHEIIEGISQKKIWFYSEGETDFFGGKRAAVGGILCEKADSDNKDECVILIPDGEDCLELREKYLNENKAVFLFYPRGVGSLKSLDAPNITHIRSSIGDILSPEYRRNCDLSMCGTSIAALRMYDALKAYDLMAKSFSKVTFAGNGNSSLYALLAAAVSESTAEVINPPQNYENFVTQKNYNRTTELEILGILKEFDIPLLIDVLK